MNKKTVLLLDKLIQLTNDNVIKWEVYEDSSLEINPELKSLFSTGILVSALGESLLPSRSYVTQYKGGCIGLFAYSHMAFSVTVKLVLQSSDASIPQTVATSDNEDTDIASKVKRLFNLIDLNAEPTNVSGYIDDILSDE